MWWLNETYCVLSRVYGFEMGSRGNHNLHHFNCVPSSSSFFVGKKSYWIECFFFILFSLSDYDNVFIVFLYYVCFIHIYIGSNKQKDESLNTKTVLFRRLGIRLHRFYYYEILSSIYNLYTFLPSFAWRSFTFMFVQFV